MDGAVSSGAVDRILNAVESLRNGRGILVVDNPDREDEGDLVFSTDFLSESQVAQTIRDCSGIICLCLPPEKVESLGLPMMTNNNSSKFGTNFTVSIDAKDGVSTGVSAKDRLRTIKTACRAGASAARDLAIPGHVFPLKADAAGVLGRNGHTEATVDIMKLAGLSPYGILCELTNKDGSMSKTPEIMKYSRAHDLPVISVKDITEMRGRYGYNPPS